MTVLGQVGFEFIEEATATFPHPESGQSVAWCTRVVELRVGKAVFHELPKSRMDRGAVLDEPEDVRGTDIRPESLAVEPEHDLEDFVSLPQGSHGICATSTPFEEPVHVLERRVHRSTDPRGQLRGQLVHLGRLATDDEDLGGQRPKRFGHCEGSRWHGEMQVHFPGRLDGFHLDDIHRPGRTASAHGVDDDEPVARGQELLGEPDACRAHFHQLDARSRPTLLQSPNDLDAEAIVAAEDVAEAGDEGAHGQRPSAGSTPTATRISPFSTATGKTASCSVPPSRRFPVRTS